MVNDKVFYDLGVDVNREWKMQNGDLVLVKYATNMQQAVQNRLTCLRDALQIYYDKYGSYLINYLGEPNTDATMEYVRMEIEDTLKQDPRIKNMEVTPIKMSESYLEVNLNIIFKNGETMNGNFVITQDTTSNLAEVADSSITKCKFITADDDITEYSEEC
jgi:phage baseplate assembly protein W